MKEYNVSIDLITTDSITETQFSECLGLSSSMFGCKHIKDGLLWRFESSASKTASLEEHIGTILSKLPGRIAIPPKIQLLNIYLSIGIFYDTMTCTVNLTSKQLTLIMSKFPNVEIEITCYPCDEALTNDVQ